MWEMISKWLSMRKITGAVINLPSGEVVKYQIGVDGVLGFRDSEEGTYVGVRFSDGTKFFCGMPYSINYGGVPT